MNLPLRLGDTSNYLLSFHYISPKAHNSVQPTLFPYPTRKSRLLAHWLASLFIRIWFIRRHLSTGLIPLSRQSLLRNTNNTKKTCSYQSSVTSRAPKTDKSKYKQYQGHPQQVRAWTLNIGSSDKENWRCNKSPAEMQNFTVHYKPQQHVIGPCYK